MTGTSIDALDAALVRVTGVGPAMSARFLRAVSVPLNDGADPLAPRLRALAEQRAIAARDIAALARDFALLHVSAIRQLLAQAGDAPPDLIAVHGQTVFHAPPLSWQLMHPAPIAHALRVPVVFDLRAADLAAGGQGAPITPIADFILFRSAAEPRTIVNLGGFCNITVLPAVAEGGGAESAALDHITGADVCPCNHLLDAVARRCLNSPYDPDGRHAAAGRADSAALDDLAQRLAHIARSGRSLGTGDELTAWIDGHAPRLAGSDLSATACAAIARTIVAAAAPAPGTRLVLAGGSTRNLALVGAIRAAHAAGQVCLSDELGTPGAYREAAAMAVLGALCQDRVPITLARVTRVQAPAPIAGHWVLP